MGTWSIWHWLVVLLIVLLVFGTKKLRNIGADLGGAVRGFKDGMKESSADKHSENEENRTQHDDSAEYKKGEAVGFPCCLLFHLCFVSLAFSEGVQDIDR